MFTPDDPGSPPGFFIPDDDEEWGLVLEGPIEQPSEDEVRATVAAVLNRADFEENPVGTSFKEVRATASAVLNRADFEENPVGTSFKIDDDIHTRAAAPARSGRGLKLAVAALLLTNIATAGFTFNYREDATVWRAMYQETQNQLWTQREASRALEGRLADTDKALTLARGQIRGFKGEEEQAARTAKALKSIRYEQGRLSLEFDRVPLNAAIQAIGKAAGMSVLISPEVGGPATASFQGVPLMDALRALIGAVGPYVMMNERTDLLEVVTREQSERRLKSIAVSLVHIKQPPSASKFELYEALRGLIEASPVEDDSIQYDSQSNAFLIRASAPMIYELKTIIRELDRPAFDSSKDKR